MKHTRSDAHTQITADEAVEALRNEVARLLALHGPDLGRPYLTWRRRLDDLMGHGGERDIAQSRLLDIYEGVVE